MSNTAASLHYYEQRLAAAIHGDVKSYWEEVARYEAALKRAGK